MVELEQLPPTPGPAAPGEPLISVGALTAAATTLIALAVAFGLPLSDTQAMAILGVVAIAAPFVVAFVGRSKVFAPDTVRAMIIKASTGQPL